MLLVLLSLLLLRPHSACAASTNLTIDDADPQVIYSPALSWRASSVDCSACFNPVSQSIAQGTFHDGTGGLHDRNRAAESDGHEDEGADGDNDEDDIDVDLMSKPTVTAQLSFTGTAVYVYCIVPDGADGDHITRSDLSFTIDDQPVGTFTRTPTGEPVSFLFNHLVFAHDGLGEGTHHLVISSPPNGALLLDYVQVTSPEVETTTTASVSSTASSSPAVSAAPVIEDAQMKHRNSVSFAVAVGATVGTLSAVTFVLCLSLYCRRRRSARRARLEAGSNGPTPTPGFVPRFFTRADHGQDEESVSGSEAPLVPGDAEEDPEDARDSGVSGAPPSTRRSRRTPRMVQIQATAPVFVPRYFPGTVIPPPPPPVVPVSNEQTRPALPSLPTQMPLLSTGSALATPLPALTEEDEAALAIMADALPPPGGEDPPPFDPVRLPSYETATLEQTDLPLPSSSEQQQQGSLDSTRL